MRSQVQSASARVQQAGNIKILTFAESPFRDAENMLARQLEGHTDELGTDHLLLDFSHVESIHSVELGTLITLHKRLKTSGGRLTLFNLRPEVFEVFTVCRLHTFLEMCEDATQD